MLDIKSGDVSDDLCSVLPALCDRFLDHRFDLLGSGWVNVHHGLSCAGLEGNRYPPHPNVRADGNGDWLGGRINRANLTESQAIWRHVKDPDYRPIDWHLDFKSGHRWSERTWYMDVEYGHLPGVDIKVPWELARLQHLPLLAAAALLSTSSRVALEEPHVYRQQIRSQILDFLANNPPRFGVNWRSPMEVSIRMANMLLAVDILRCSDQTLDQAFLTIVRRSVWEHATHVAAHLEWSESGRSNHYLADVLGLVTAGAYLTSSPGTDAMLAFAIGQLNCEASVQFNPDGSSYEGSTSYHGLSAELLVYAAALVAGLPDERVKALSRSDSRHLIVRPSISGSPFTLYELSDGQRSPLSPQLVRLLPRLVEFSRGATKPDGHIVQVGDTDSGRLFKLQSTWRTADSSDGPEEDHLDHCHVGSGIAGLMNEHTPADADHERFDTRVVRALACGRTLPAAPDDRAPIVPSGCLASILDDIGERPSTHCLSRQIPVAREALEGLASFVFPDFGLYVMKGDRFFLSMRCANPRPDAPTSHNHDDNLSIELQVDGIDLISDPGSYLYTSSPEMRDRYRSAAAHDAPRVKGRDAASMTGLLFDFQHRSTASMLTATVEGLAGELRGKDWRVMRVVRVADDLITITDASWGGELAPLRERDCLPLMSVGYGKTIPRPARIV